MADIQLKKIKAKKDAMTIEIVKIQEELKAMRAE